jgi:capsular exopolysaccharide synthesis family protein
LFEEEQEQERQMTLNDYLRIAYRGRWIIVICFIVVFVSSVYFTMTSPSIYLASTTVLIESTGSMERNLFGTDYFGGQTTLISNQIEILKSRKLAESSIRRLELCEVKDSLSIFQPDEEGNKASFRSMVRWLQGNMEVEHRKDTDVIEISFNAFTPFECAYIANIIAEEFKLLNAKTSAGEVNDLREFLEKQLNVKEKELRQAEEKLRSYQEQKKVADLDGETTQLVNQLAQAESMLEQARIELNAALQRKQTINEQLEERRASLGDDLGGTSTPYILSLQNELGQAVAERTKYIVAIESETQNPNRLTYEGRIKYYDEKIKALREKLEEESQKIKASSMVSDAFQISQELLTNLMSVETEIKSQTAKIDALKEVVRVYEGDLEKLPLTTLELARLERDRKVQEGTYIMMVTKLEETKITQAGQTGSVRLLDEAIEPAVPIKPNKKMNLMLGALIGLGLGIGLTFVIEYFDNTIKRIEQVEQLGFNLLGAIPKIPQEKLEKKKKQKEQTMESDEAYNIESRLVTHFDPKSPISEAYRTLRTNLQFTRLDKPLQSLMVTSAGPKEGKSTTVANLAITLAQLGTKVILVDSDLRRPVIHGIFGMSKDVGLTNYMVDSVPFDNIIKDSFMDNLKIITCGVLPPNPSELLGSKKMEELINKLKSEFDLVLFDSPPVIAVTDAAILSTKVDGAFFVISSGTANRDAILRAKAQLENVKAPVVGALLNNVDVEGTYGSSYYYYYYHYYHGTHSGKDGKFWRRSRRNRA